MYIERQNAIRTSVTLFVCGSQRTYLFLQRFDVIVRCQSTHARPNVYVVKCIQGVTPAYTKKTLVIYVVIRLLGHCLYRQINQKLSLAL